MTFPKEPSNDQVPPINKGIDALMVWARKVRAGEIKVGPQAYQYAKQLTFAETYGATPRKLGNIRQ
ncbi:MAG: hypothetical protein E6Q97_34825 [Desulfurellales bacterium]|nr:MAG: hypothetical protein E6Q97_34825 [Desulfurellales bacterium]